MCQVLALSVYTLWCSIGHGHWMNPWEAIYGPRRGRPMLGHRQGGRRPVQALLWLPVHGVMDASPRIREGSLFSIGNGRWMNR